MMQSNKGLHMVAWVLLIVGGLNWLLVGFGWNLVDSIFGMFARWIYILVGLAAIYELVCHKAMCKACDVGAETKPPMGGGMPISGLPK